MSQKKNKNSDTSELSPHSLNPGLLYYRYYFNPVSAKVPPLTNWHQERKQQHDEKQEKDQKDFESKSWNKQKTFKPQKFQQVLKDENALFGASPNTAAAAVHFAGLNAVLFGRYDDKAQLKQQEDQLDQTDSSELPLQTTYPGLLVGLGYNHQISSEKAINAGFSFDYTTGLPYLPGSSVKGVLRAAFTERDKAHKQRAKKIDRPSYDAIIAGKKGWLRKQAIFSEWSDQEFSECLPALEKLLFESLLPGTVKEYLPTPHRAIFHDALLVALANGEYLFGPDNITPHKSANPKKVPDRYAEPNPISLLKVLPGVSFRFAFTLPEALLKAWNGPEISEGKLRLLFKNILLEYGIGAKTRLGYGRFADETLEWPAEDDLEVFEDKNFKDLPGNYEKRSQNSNSTHGKQNKNKANTGNRNKTTTQKNDKSTDTEEAEVVKIENGKITLRFNNERTRFYDLDRDDYADLRNANPGERYLVTVKSRFSDGNVEYLRTPQTKIS